MNPNARQTAPGLLRQLFALFAGAALLLLGLFFSLIVLALVAVAALTAWAYFWWKTRKLRRALREQRADSQVIEGVAIVVDDQEAPPRDDNRLEQR